jgi:hypothetical protein
MLPGADEDHIRECLYLQDIATGVAPAAAGGAPGDDMGGTTGRRGIASGVQRGGTVPGGGPGAGLGSVGTGGASTGGTPTGNVKRGGT